MTCQTTLSVWDTEELIEAVRRRYPGCEVHNEICRATQERQEAAARDVDLVIVVGSPRWKAPGGSGDQRRLDAEPARPAGDPVPGVPGARLTRI